MVVPYHLGLFVIPINFPQLVGSNHPIYPLGNQTWQWNPLFFGGFNRSIIQLNDLNGAFSGKPCLIRNSLGIQRLRSSEAISWAVLGDTMTMPLGPGWAGMRRFQDWHFDIASGWILEPFWLLNVWFIAKFQTFLSLIIFKDSKRTHIMLTYHYSWSWIIETQKNNYI